jgi:hypothetical protein
MRLYSDAIGIDQLLYLLASHVIESYEQWGPKRKVKGGGGLAFQSTVRVDLKWMKLFVRNMMETRDLKKKGETFGARTLATAVKNRVAPPHRFAIMDVYYDRGLDPYSGLLDHLVRQNRVVRKKKAAKGASVWRLDAKHDFLEDELEKLVADEDVLGIKKAGKEYMAPVRVLGDVSQEDIEEGADELPPPPPPPAPVRKAAEEE